MSAASDLELVVPTIFPLGSIDDQKNVDDDALKLAEMGYTQDLRREFSAWAVSGVGFSLTNSWFAISAALITGTSSGGRFSSFMEP